MPNQGGGGFVRYRRHQRFVVDRRLISASNVKGHPSTVPIGPVSVRSDRVVDKALWSSQGDLPSAAHSLRRRDSWKGREPDRGGARGPTVPGITGGRKNDEGIRMLQGLVVHDMVTLDSRGGGGGSKELPHIPVGKRTHDPALNQAGGEDLGAEWHDNVPADLLPGCQKVRLVSCSSSQMHWDVPECV